MNSRDNILQLALTNNALEKFIVGEPPYFQKGKTDNEEPQNVMGAFDQLVVRHWRETHDARFASQFVAAQLSALATCPDANRAMYMVSDWLWYYRFCLTKRLFRPQGPHADLFDIDTSAVAQSLKRRLEANKAGLINDARWAGSPRNSQAGFWEPLMRTALNVRDKLGGPDFVPAHP